MEWARQDRQDRPFMEGGDLRSSIFSTSSDHNLNQDFEIPGKLYPEGAQGGMRIKE